MKTRERLATPALVALVCALTVCAPAEEAADAFALADVVPAHETDPTWPNVPADWEWGQVLGISVDSRDHVWVTSRSQVVEFDPDGDMVRAWGGRDVGEDWPRMLHGLFVDHNDFVWSAAREQHMIHKFTRDGEQVLTIGRLDETGGSNDTELLGRPAELWVDPGTNELYVGDGYGNRRIIVFDAETGAYLRHWGAYGEVPDDDYEFDNESTEPAAQFRTLHGIVGSKDGLIYVADRTNSRVQVFRPSGEYVTEKILRTGRSAAFSIAFSPDPEQHFLYVADGTEHKILILERSTLELVGEFGSEGPEYGQLGRPHNLTVDSRGHVYVAEADPGMRPQKFTFTGMVAR